MHRLQVSESFLDRVVASAFDPAAGSPLMLTELLGDLLGSRRDSYTPHWFHHYSRCGWVITPLLPRLCSRDWESVALATMADWGGRTSEAEVRGTVGKWRDKRCQSGEKCRRIWSNPLEWRRRRVCGQHLRGRIYNKVNSLNWPFWLMHIRKKTK